MATNYVSTVVMPGGTTTYYIKDSAGRRVIGFTAFQVGQQYAVGDYVIDTDSTTTPTGENL